MDPSEDQLARHEAAHALIAHLLGGEVRWVTLESDEDDHAGNTEVAWSGLDPETVAERSAKAALAGPLAELHHEGRHVLQEPETLAAWRRDWQEVEGALAGLERNPALRRERLVRWLAEVSQLLADVVVAEHLSRVADALEAHGTLDRDLFLDCLD